MKYLFLVALLVLVAASVATKLSLDHADSGVPVLYWVTDDNPARKEQVRRFHAWLEKNHYPKMELRTDTANRDLSKMIVQGVSGVGGDILDIWSADGDMLYFQQMGMLEDITGQGLRMGFDPGQTFPSMQPQITQHGRQYMFPCNVCSNSPWVNLATFRKYGQEPPPWRWSLEEFERRGKAFVAAANPPGERRTVFFIDSVPPAVIARSLGVTSLNETLTAPAMDDPRYVQALKLVKKWTYEDHLIPTAADASAFSTESGYQGSMMQLFNQGNYAMVSIGLYGLIQCRQFGALDLAVVEPPNGGFPNIGTGTRAAAIYAGGKQKELAAYFLKFLASEEYNSQIVDDADGLPPNPLYTRGEPFSHPPKYPNEWKCHDPFLELEKIAIGPEFSDFVPPSTVTRIITLYQDRFMNDRCTAEQATRDMASQIRAEIQRTLEEDPALQPRYQQMVQRQNEIDQLRREGKPVPLAWLENPFYRQYYKFKGWAQ